MISLKSLIREEFEKPSALFNNPAYDNVVWADVLKKFQAEGGEVLRQGTYATV